MMMFPKMTVRAFAEVELLSLIFVQTEQGTARAIKGYWGEGKTPVAITLQPVGAFDIPGMITPDKQAPVLSLDVEWRIEFGGGDPPLMNPSKEARLAGVTFTTKGQLLRVWQWQTLGGSESQAVALHLESGRVYPLAAQSDVPLEGSWHFNRWVISVVDPLRPDTTKVLARWDASEESPTPP